MLTGSINFQTDNVRSYTLFFEGFVAKLEAFAKEFQGTIEEEAREVAR